MLGRVLQGFTRVLRTEYVQLESFLFILFYSVDNVLSTILTFKFELRRCFGLRSCVISQDFDRFAKCCSFVGIVRNEFDFIRLRSSHFVLSLLGYMYNTYE